MPDWDLRVETMPGLLADASPMAELSDSLEADTQLRDVRTGVNVQTGVLDASFTVRAGTQGEACHVAVDAFCDGLKAAGYDTSVPGWRLNIYIEPTGYEGLDDDG